MLIDDKLLDTQYTEYLNNLYPPRKYLKHNLTSSKRFNKFNSKNINIKFLNPKLNSFGLEQIHNNLDELSLDYINSLPQALTIIQKLKTKIIEYDLANNQNIELAQEHIFKLEDENCFLKEQLKDCYTKLGKYSEKYGDEILNKYVYNIINKFKVKWSRIKLLKFFYFNYLVNKKHSYIIKQMLFNKYYNLKLKGFLSLQKNYLYYLNINKMNYKRELLIKFNLLNLFKINNNLNLKERSFFKYKKGLSKIFTFKKLSINCVKSKNNKINNKKSMFYYKQCLIKKAINSYKINLYTNIKYNLKPSLRHNNFIKFTNFLVKRGYDKLSTNRKSKYNYGLISLKKIITQTHERVEKKYLYKNKIKVLSNFFDIWKSYITIYNRNIQVLINTSKEITKLFFMECKKNIYRKDYESNIKLIQSHTFFKCFKKRIKQNNITKVVYPSMLIKKSFIRMLKNMKFKTNLKNNIIFKNIMTPILIKSAIDIFKYKIYNMKKNIFIENLIKNIANKRLLNLKVRLGIRNFFKNIDNRVFLNKKIKIFKKKLTGLEIFSKTLNKIRTKCLFKRVINIKTYYVNLIEDMKKIIEEKSINLNCLESKLIVNDEEMQSLLNSNNNLYNENEYLKKQIELLEDKMNEDKQKSSILFEKNINDIKSKYK